MLCTPDYSHATTNDWNRIYEPSEDTFLLIDAIEQDIDFIFNRKPSVCLEVGCGSGLVICALAEKFRNVPLYLAIDLNPYAVQFTKATAFRNNVRVEVVQSDLMNNLRVNLIDLIVFNPPYVVTPSEEVEGNGIERAWAGGVKGREITDKFIGQLNACLSKNGFGYLVLLDENLPFEVVANLEGNGFYCKFILRRKIRGENLQVLRFSKIETKLSA